MPIPIQLGSLTTRLRNFLRIRGRVRLQLDETVVPTVQVQDLTRGPYIAGVQPAAGTLVSSGTVGGQTVIFLNPTATLPMVASLAADDRFAGVSFSITALELRQRVAGLSRYRVGIVPRTLLTAATLVTSRLCVDVSAKLQTPVLTTVPVLIATVPVIPLVVFGAANEWWHGETTLAGELASVPQFPATTIDRESALIIEFLVANALTDVSVRGTYQTQPG